MASDSRAGASGGGPRMPAANDGPSAGPEGAHNPTSAAAPSSPRTTEDAVRVCAVHNLALEECGDHLVCPARRRHRVTRWRVVSRRLGRSLYEADKEGAKAVDEKTTVAQSPEPKSETLERAKFEDGAKQVLFVRLTKEPKRWGGDPFRIRWQQGPAGTLGKGTTQGVAKTCPDEPAARAAYKAAVRSVIADGWKQVPIGLGGCRKLELKPIPAPKKRAA